jgi:hypothetical protein
MGLVDFSPKEILANLQPHINVFREYYGAAYSRVLDVARFYEGVTKDRDLSRVKLLYLEALRDGVSLERVRGRIEAIGLKPEDFEDSDTEMQIIVELFIN